MSTPPLPYNRKANFISYEGPNPTRPKRGTDLDAEFDDIERALGGTQARLAEIQRDDGLLANGSVHKDAIDPAVIAGLGGDPTGAIEAIGAIRDDASTAAIAASQSANTASDAASAASQSADAAASSATSVLLTDPDARKLHSSFETPNMAVALCLDWLVQRLKKSGVWDRLDALYLTCLHDVQACMFNVKDPDHYNLELAGGTVVHAPFSHIRSSDGAVLDTGFDIRSDGLYSPDDAHMAVWVAEPVEDSAIGAGEMGLSNTAAYAYLNASWDSAGRMAYRANRSGGSAATRNVQAGPGLTLWSREASDQVFVQKNGRVNSLLGTSESTAFPSSASYVRLLGNGANRTTASISAASFGASLTREQAYSYDKDLSDFLHILRDLNR